MKETNDIIFFFFIYGSVHTFAIYALSNRCRFLYVWLSYYTTHPGAELCIYVAHTNKYSNCKFYINKKVLLRERKRHTARRVASTPYVVLTGYSPPWPGCPPLAGPGRVPPQPGYPPWLDLAGYPPGWPIESGWNPKLHSTLLLYNKQSFTCEHQTF